MGTSVEIPRYTCNKKVRAAKITKIENHESDGTHSNTLYFGEISESKLISHAYMKKHEPRVGGYYVLYKDGYESFSPADAFEDGYTKD